MMQFEIFAGIDWSTKVRQVAVVDAGGKVLGEQAFARSGDGLAAMGDWILERESESEGRAAVAIEKPHGPEADALLERGIAVFAPDPKQLDRFSPAGAKDDRRDALVLADREGWRMPRNPGSTGDRRRRSIKCHVKYWGHFCTPIHTDMFSSEVGMPTQAIACVFFSDEDGVMKEHVDERRRDESLPEDVAQITYFTALRPTIR